MTREEIKKFLDNTKVYVNGKSIEIQEKLFSFGYKWYCDKDYKVQLTEKPFLFISDENTIKHGKNIKFFKMHEYREITAEEILSLEVTEPSYRPFKNKDECWNEMQKHRPFGWLYDKANNSYNLRINISDNSYFERLFNEYSFADGAPFGIKED